MLNRHDEILKLAYGQMGLSTREIAEITPFAFFNYKLPGYNDRLRDDKVFLRRICEILVLPHVAKNSHFDIKSYIPIAGDLEGAARLHPALTREGQKTMLENLVRKRAENKK